MEEGKLEEFKDDFFLLVEAGFIAVKQLDEVSSTHLFHAAQALDPDHSSPLIGLGYIALNKLNTKEASRIFELVLKAEPENYLAQTFLGMTYLFTKSKGVQGKKLIQEAMEKSSEPAVQNLGQVALEWAHKELPKKTGSQAPFFAANSTEDKHNKEK